MGFVENVILDWPRLIPCHQGLETETKTLAKWSWVHSGFDTYVLRFQHWSQEPISWIFDAFLVLLFILKFFCLVRLTTVSYLPALSVHYTIIFTDWEWNSALLRVSEFGARILCVSWRWFWKNCTRWCQSGSVCLLFIFFTTDRSCVFFAWFSKTVLEIFRTDQFY